jgi:SAM-dependent methyltransferase
MPRTEPFEKQSDRYDAWFEKNRDVYHAEIEAIRQMIPFPEAWGVEVGVGSGKFAGPLGIKIGVEPAESMAAKAEKLGIHVFRDVAEELPFSDAEFDFVLMVTTICFVEDILQSFREAFRVLKPRGCIIVGFVDKESELGKQYLDRRDSSVFYKEAIFFSSREVSDYIINAGFGDLTFRQALIPGESQGMIRDGFGKGAFVVIRGVKKEQT